MLTFLLQGVGLGISAALSPGPFQSIIIAQSLARGWRQTLPIIFAPLIGDIPIAILMVVLLRQLPASVLDLISLAGAVLLLFLAWGIYQDLNSNDNQGPKEAKETALGPGRALLMGLSMLFMSPGPYLYWSLVLGPLLLSALEASLPTAIAFLFGFYLSSIGGLALMSILLARLGGVSSRINRSLRIASLVLMVIIALLLVLRAFA